MFCSQCGRKIPEGLDNCPVCSGGEVAPVIRMGGRKVTAAPEERTPHPWAVFPTQPLWTALRLLLIEILLPEQAKPAPALLCKTSNELGKR